MLGVCYPTAQSALGIAVAPLGSMNPQKHVVYTLDLTPGGSVTLVTLHRSWEAAQKEIKRRLVSDTRTTVHHGAKPVYPVSDPAVLQKRGN